MSVRQLLILLLLLPSILNASDATGAFVSGEETTLAPNKRPYPKASRNKLKTNPCLGRAVLSSQGTPTQRASPKRDEVKPTSILMLTHHQEASKASLNIDIKPLTQRNGRKVLSVIIFYP